MWQIYKLRNSFLLLFSAVTLFFYGCQEEKLDVHATGILDGTVLDFTSEENLSGAILTTNPPTVSVASDSTGYFIFKTIEVGDYNLIARKNGFVSESVSVSVQQDKTTSVVVLLERSSEYNDPPVFENSFTPSNGQTGQLVDLTLSWSAVDPNNEDSLVYNVVLYESNNSESWVFEDIEESFVEVEGLLFNTVYFWQVTASDPYISVQSELLSFRTIPLPDNPIHYAAKTENGYEIYSSDTAQSNVVRLTRDNSDEWQPRLSPSGDLVAYVAHYNLEPHIFTMERDGTNQRRISKRPITGYNNPGRGFAWSPQGDKIIYANYDRLSFIQYDGTIEGVLSIAPANRHYRDLDWSPDGTKIVAQTMGVNYTDNEIYLMNANGSNPIVLVSNLEGIIESPTFSIDSKKVMYTRDMSGYSSGTGRQLDAHIFIIDINTLQISDISQNKPTGTNDTNPRFSPNGAYVIFEHASNVAGSEKSLWMMNTNGTGRVEIINNAEMPDWR
jgi:TolB protein